MLERLIFLSNGDTFLASRQGPRTSRDVMVRARLPFVSPARWHTRLEHPYQLPPSSRC